MELTKKHKKWIIAGSIAGAFLISMSAFLGAAAAKSKKDGTVASCTLSMLGNFLRNKNKIAYESFDDNAEFPVNDFRVSMSAMNHWEDSDNILTYDYTFSDGVHQANDMKSLQQLYNAYGATEMYVRIATKRTMPTADYPDYYHAKMHNLAESKKVCGVAAELGMPINVELGVFAAYSDAFESQYPDFDEYDEFDYPKDIRGERKAWADMDIDEICSVLRQYGKLVATEIAATGCTVNYWDLGNETNFGFAGIMMPLKSSVSRATRKKNWVTYLKKDFGMHWLAKNIWNHNGKMFAAVADGIKEVHPDAKFSSHISTVMWGPAYAVKYFKTLSDNGYTVDQAGISYYPNATGVILDKVAQIKQIVLALNRELGMNVMLAEYGYANETGLASGTFSSWNNKVHGYELTDEDGARFLSKLIGWGKKNGMAGIRPWAPELDWAMPWFDFNKQTKTAAAKTAIFNALKNAVE